MRTNNKISYKKIQLPFKIKKAVLALGSQTKNTVCYAKGKLAFFSRVHPDLSSPADLDTFLQDSKNFLKARPKIVAYDLHPEYASTKFALTLRPKTYDLRPIQHHHAHIVSCMAENGLRNQKVIGVAFDGTGLGSDNSLWGAEFLICDYKNCFRKAHLRKIPLLGGEKAISEPWRLAVAWLNHVYKDKFLALGIDFARAVDKKKWLVLKRMCSTGLNSPLASSMGRLFDAVASLALNKHNAKFEAELAINLEKMALRHKDTRTQGHKFDIIKEKDEYIIDPNPMFKEIVQELMRNEPKEKIAFKFHLSVAEMIRKTCIILRKDNKINRVVLSGGVFQNKLLLSLSLDLLRKDKFKVFFHRALSCNDSGISLGQCIIANSRG